MSDYPWTIERLIEYGMENEKPLTVTQEEVKEIIRCFLTSDYVFNFSKKSVFIKPMGLNVYWSDE